LCRSRSEGPSQPPASPIRPPTMTGTRVTSMLGEEASAQSKTYHS
jgi:hypothetical protein